MSEFWSWYMGVGFTVWFLAIMCTELKFEVGMLAYFGWPLYVAIIGMRGIRKLYDKDEL